MITLTVFCFTLASVLIGWCICRSAALADQEINRLCSTKPPNSKTP